jgi:zinc/manganese transport system substrate-binding protein
LHECLALKKYRHAPEEVTYSSRKLPDASLARTFLIALPAAGAGEQLNDLENARLLRRSVVRAASEEPMTVRKLFVVTLGCVLILCASAQAEVSRPKVVAAQNFYGDVARQIGGAWFEVLSIMSSPDQDPHLFEATPAVARQLSEAQIVILNGANYDQWVNKLLSASPRAGRVAINVADLVGKKSGDNPHLWYQPATMQALALALARTMSEIDPVRAADYLVRQQAFESSLAPLNQKIAQIRTKYGGVAITATEPVFGYMAAALGLSMRNERFQLAVMNDTEPSARDIAAFENDLKTQQVKALIFNKQAITNLTKRMLDTAQRARIPVVGVTETEPAGVNYQDWMLMQLNELQKALADMSK